MFYASVFSALFSQFDTFFQIFLNIELEVCGDNICPQRVSVLLLFLPLGSTSSRFTSFNFPKLW